MGVITEVHKTYCKNCPSKWHPADPESLDIASMPDGKKQMHVFTCAWRGEKLCKGVCEDLNYTEEKWGEKLAINRSTETIPKDQNAQP